MKNIIAIMLLASAFNVFADPDCRNATNQAEINLCAYEQLDAASIALSKAIEKKCLKDPAVREWQGGTGYGAALAGCQTKIFKSLKKQIK